MRKMRSTASAIVAVALGLTALAMPTTLAADGQTIASGTFRGENGHVASGGVSM